MKIIKVLGFLSLSSLVFIQSNSQVHSSPKVLAKDSSQNKINWKDAVEGNFISELSQHGVSLYHKNH